MNLKIKNFNPNMIKAGEDVCVFIGKRNTGKSYLLRDILSHIHSKFKITIAFSQTEQVNHFYEKFIPKMFINYKWDENKLEKIFKFQDESTKKEPLGLIFDDMISDSSSWRNNYYIKKIFLEGRHYKVGFFLLTQFVNCIGPFAKTNIDYIFILKQQNLKEKEKLYNEFGGGFPDKKTFILILDKLTENRGCMVISNKTQSNKLEDIVFGYRAASVPPIFRCCENSFWYKQQDIEFKRSISQRNKKEITLDKGVKIELKEFIPKNMSPKRRFFIIGKTNTGKSYLLRDLLYNIKHKYANGVVCSHSEKLNQFYSKFIPSSKIYPDHNSKLLESILHTQERLIKKYPDSNTNMFLIYDDLTSESKIWGKDKHIQEIYMVGRHYNLGFFLLSQYTNAVPPYAKNNVDYIFILQQQNYEEKFRLYKEYGSVFSSKKDFYKALDQLTTNNGCLVIDNTIKSNKVEDRVFYYKAVYPPPEFRMF
jgi:hypothetical protein